MKRYISFFDYKANKSSFCDISHTADVSVKVSKKDIVIEISNEYYNGVAHTHKWDESETEKVNQFFKDKLEDKLAKLVLFFVTQRVREFVAKDSLKNAVLDIEEEEKVWSKHMHYIFDHMEKLKGEPETTNE